MANSRTKLKIFSIAHKGVVSQYFGAIDFKDNENYVETKVRLEEIGFFEWHFYLWDVGDGCGFLCNLSV